MSTSTERHVATVALIGNPNTGKSTLFTGLVGVRQHVGNYPGVTVEKKTGRMDFAGRSFELIDLPGLYSIAPRSRDEMVAVDLLLGRREDVAAVDAVLLIVDASNLDRNLYLVSQVLELGLPTVLALNMLDVAETHGIGIDGKQLERHLGIPVVPIQAHRRTGLERLKQALARSSAKNRAFAKRCCRSPLKRKSRFWTLSYRPALRRRDGRRLPRYLLRRLLLDMNGYLQQSLFDDAVPEGRQHVDAARARLAEIGCRVPGVETAARYNWVRKILEGVVTEPPQRKTTVSDRIDRVLTHRLWGLVVFAAVMLAMFQSVFVWRGRS